MARDIVVFTLHKSASMFLHRQCQRLCELGAIPYHSPNVPQSGMNARRLLTDQDLWRTHHGCFAPVRFFVDIPRIEEFDVVLHLRDPRDVLVSMFYSYCFIHPGEIPPDTGYRREVALRGIDEFVLGKCSAASSTYRGDYGTGGHVESLIGNLPQRYRNYIDRLLGKPNVTFVKYEEMVNDYRSWLERFSAPFPLGDRGALLDAWAEEHSALIPARTGDVMTHVRHVAPGDHRAKLKAATIAELNRIFADTLNALGYA